jgi:hypothetical protein
MDKLTGSVERITYYSVLRLREVDAIGMAVRNNQVAKRFTALEWRLGLLWAPAQLANWVKLPDTAAHRHDILLISPKWPG